MSLNTKVKSIKIATCELRLYVDLPEKKREDYSKNYSIKYFNCHHCNGRKIKCPAYKPAYNNQNVI